MAIVALLGIVDVNPSALGEGDVAADGTLLHHGSDHHVTSPQVLIPNAVVTADVVIILIEAQRAHQRQTCRSVIVGQGVVIGQPPVALLDDAQCQVAELGVVVRLGMIGRVGAQHG